MLENVIVLHLNEFSTSSRANQPRQMNGHSLTTLWNFPSIFVEKWQGQHHPAVRLICFTKVKSTIYMCFAGKEIDLEERRFMLDMKSFTPIDKASRNGSFFDQT